MVGFLKARGHITDEEADAWLSAESLVISTTFEGPAPSRAGRMVLWGAVASAAVAAGWMLAERGEEIAAFVRSLAQ
jgi:hypothetical protein